MNRNSGRTWINFKELRAKLKIEDVLRLYKVEIRLKDEDQHLGICPLPSHTAKKSVACFSVNLALGIFHCFGCGAKGNTLEFAALMDGVDPKNGSALRKVAVKLQKEFFPDTAQVGQKVEEPTADLFTTPAASTVVVNGPLDFTLKGLDRGHPYCRSRGIQAGTVEYFGAGACSRGLLKDCLAIPLHDASGTLLGYAGRPLDDDSLGDEISRYSLPVRRERNGTTVDFQKSRFLYNGFRAEGPSSDIVLVEGFISVWWLHQNGVRNVVSTMGLDVSDEQIEAILDLVCADGTVWVLPGGDIEGEKLVHSVLYRIAPSRRVRWVRLDTGKSPVELTPGEIKETFFA